MENPEPVPMLTNGNIDVFTVNVLVFLGGQSYRVCITHAGL